MAVQKQDDQHEHTFSGYVRIRYSVLKTYLERWMIGRSGERVSEISVLPARYDDDFIARVRKDSVGFYCERKLETEHNWNILTEQYWNVLTPSALCLSPFPGLLNRSPGVHSAGCWLSLLQLVLLRPQLYSNVLPSVQFVGLILPSNSHAVIWTRLYASAISSDIWRSGCVTSAIFGIACVIVIEWK